MLIQPLRVFGFSHWDSRDIRRQIEMMTALVVGAGVGLYAE